MREACPPKISLEIQIRASDDGAWIAESKSVSK